MAKSGTFGDIKYWTDGKGRHTFEAMTQKPFAQFKDEINEGLQNSWARTITSWNWEGQTCHVTTWGGDAVYKLENGKASIALRTTGFPASWTEGRIIYEIRQKFQQACYYSRSAEIENESRKSLRDSALQTFHDAYVNEVEASILIGRWQMVDEITRVMAALTASGSAVAGWLVWEDKGWKKPWAIAAGTASVLSILHVALKVSDRVKDWSDTKGHFARLRTELETFVYHMKVNPSFPLAEFTDKFDGYRARFSDGIDRKKFDFLAFGMSRARHEAGESRDALNQRTALG